MAVRFSRNPALNPTGLGLAAASVLLVVATLTLPALAGPAWRIGALLLIGLLAYGATVAIGAWPRPESRALRRALKIRSGLADLHATCQARQQGQDDAGLAALVEETLGHVDHDLLPSLEALGERAHTFALTIRQSRRDQTIQPSLLSALEKAHREQARSMEQAVDALSASYAELLLLSHDRTTGKAMADRQTAHRDRLSAIRCQLHAVLNAADDWDRRLASRRR